MTTENSEFLSVWTEGIVRCSWAERGTMKRFCSFIRLNCTQCWVVKLVQFYFVLLHRPCSSVLIESLFVNTPCFCKHVSMVYWYCPCKHITCHLKDVNLMFSWQEQHGTGLLCLLVRYCSCHSHIIFISSYHHVISSEYVFVCIGF